MPNEMDDRTVKHHWDPIKIYIPQFREIFDDVASRAETIPQRPTTNLVKVRGGGVEVHINCQTVTGQTPVGHWDILPISAFRINARSSTGSSVVRRPFQSNYRLLGSRLSTGMSRSPRPRCFLPTLTGLMRMEKARALAVRCWFPCLDQLCKDQPVQYQRFCTPLTYNILKQRRQL